MIRTADAAGAFIERMTAISKDRAGADYGALFERKRKDEPKSAAVEDWEGALYAELSGQMVKISLDKGATRSEDTLLTAYFADRFRDDDKDAAWHLRAPTYQNCCRM